MASSGTKHAIDGCRNCGRLFFNTEDFLANTGRWRICSEENLWFECVCGASNMIEKGQYDWYDPMHQFSTQARSIFNELPGINALPPLPQVTLDLLTLIDSEDTSSQSIADLAKQDPVLSARILRIAENLTPRGSGEIKSLAHAISLIGRRAVKEIALLASVTSHQPKTKIFHVETFWNHSFTIGHIAENLNRRFGTAFSPDEVFIGGCVSNIGKLVLALIKPEVADQFQAEMHNLRTLGPWRKAEERHSGLQHTVIGEIGAVFWGLSLSATHCIQNHHSVKNADPGVDLQLYELVALANQFAHWVHLQPHCMEKELFEALQRRFGLSNQQSNALAEELMPLAIPNAPIF